ncbi:MAG TPA: CHRD domain-containing protein, partial [Stellaceae bacterium]
TAALALDTASKTLTWSVEYSGLSKPPEMAGFLAPAAKPDDDPDMVPVDLPKDAKSPMKGSTTLNDAQATAIQKGDWIFLIGTTEAPEIGGEVKKAQ